MGRVRSGFFFMRCIESNSVAERGVRISEGAVHLLRGAYGLASTGDPGASSRDASVEPFGWEASAGEGSAGTAAESAACSAEADVVDSACSSSAGCCGLAGGC